jgi:plasmid stabilization system protein ParE
VTKLRVLPAAEAEPAAAARWYEARQTGLGVEFVVEVDAALERVEARPASFPVWRVGSTYRRARLKRFPYLIFFRILDGEIEIVAVAHAKNIDSRTSPIEGRSSPTRVCGVLMGDGLEILCMVSIA